MATAIPSVAGSVVGRAYATIAAALSTFQATPWVYDLLPGGGREVGHLGYGVGLLSTRPQDPDGKQRAGSFLNVESEIGVRIMYRLKADAQTDDYRLALTTSDLVVATLITAADGSATNFGPQKWHWLENRCRVVADGTYALIEQRYRVWHVSSINL